MSSMPAPLLAVMITNPSSSLGSPMLPRWNCPIAAKKHGSPEASLIR